MILYIFMPSFAYPDIVILSTLKALPSQSLLNDILELFDIFVHNLGCTCMKWLFNIFWIQALKNL